MGGCQVNFTVKYFNFAFDLVVSIQEDHTTLTQGSGSILNWVMGQKFFQSELVWLPCKQKAEKICQGHCKHSLSLLVSIYYKSVMITNNSFDIIVDQRQSIFPIGNITNVKHGQQIVIYEN